MQTRFKFRTLVEYCGVPMWLFSNNLYEWCNDVDKPFQGVVIQGIEPNDTLGLYTGFNDKHGKEIYEGDILRSDNYPFSDGETKDNYFLEIGWDEGCGAFYSMCHKRNGAHVRGISDGISDFLSEEKLMDFEVIGNIYDNEDLFEDEAETI